MRSYTLWESKRRRNRWTLYLGAAGHGKHRHRVRLDRLNVRTNELRTWIPGR